MFFPEFLFRLSQRDEQVTWLDPYFDYRTGSAAATSVSAGGALRAVPDGRALLLQSAQAFGTPGAGQNIVSMNLFVTEPNQVQQYPLVQLADLAANADGVLAWSGSIILPPGWLVRTTGIFNAGVAANFVDSTIIGLLIPIGNIQRV